MQQITGTRTSARHAGIPDKLGRMITVAVIAISAVTAWSVARVDYHQMSIMRARQEFSTRAPPGGKLAGQNALDNSEWTAGDKVDGTLVLFAVGPAGQVGDLAYWYYIASKARGAVHNLRFVGLCGVAHRTCSSPPGDGRLIVLLASMDPSQVHGVVAAEKRDQFLLYQGSMMRMLSVGPDRDAVLRQISDISNQATRGGGT